MGRRHYATCHTTISTHAANQIALTNESTVSNVLAPQHSRVNKQTDKNSKSHSSTPCLKKTVQTYFLSER